MFEMHHKNLNCLLYKTSICELKKKPDKWKGKDCILDSVTQCGLDGGMCYVYEP